VYLHNNKRPKQRVSIQRLLERTLQISNLEPLKIVRMVADYIPALRLGSRISWLFSSQGGNFSLALSKNTKDWYYISQLKRAQPT